MLNYFFFILLWLASFASASASFIVGKDYEIIKNTHSPSTTTLTTVTEFFSFGCPWCYRLEPALNHWVKQQGTKITFKKIPVMFHKDWDYYAKAYYVAEALALNSTLNPALFKAILDDKQSLNTNQAMIDFFIKQGVEPSIAKSAFTHAPSIEMELNNSKIKMARYHITAVPAFVINHRFKTDLQMAKTEGRLLAILDFLIAQK